MTLASSTTLLSLNKAKREIDGLEAVLETEIRDRIDELQVARNHIGRLNERIADLEQQLAAAKAVITNGTNGNGSP